ncbi:MAG: beta-lactamase family protein [Acidimicrobiia bacterium]|nr:beta-lactamase family protein [Acidimicrobiia bacterium]MDH5236964.1 beta-lactamase family protein [Acidimicrobiia bacterium]
MSSEPPIHGTCAPAYASVRQAFAANFDHGDIGASCAVTVGGELVVDLWGGHRDVAGRVPWERDTIVNVWSTTKMMTALCVLMLHDRDALSIDAPVAEYWPEFAANGKETVLIRHVLGHTAGLPVFDSFVDDIEVFDWQACCARLAGQAPRWTPGDGSGYHAETQGWLLGELVRRVDGRTVGTFFREEVAQPSEIDFHIGLDDRHFERVADVAVLSAQATTPADTALRSLESPTSRRSAGLVNTSAWRRAEMPASNGHGNARAVASAMAPLANDGHLGDRRLLSPATIERCFDVQADGVDRMTGQRFRLGIGYGLNGEGTPLGVNDRTLWWAGWGGSMCVIDVENDLTVAYVMNRMLGEGDIRAAGVIFAAHAARADA